MLIQYDTVRYNKIFMVGFSVVLSVVFLAIFDFDKIVFGDFKVQKSYTNHFLKSYPQFYRKIILKLNANG